MPSGSTENTMSTREGVDEPQSHSMDDRAEFRKNAFEKTVLEREKQDGSFSILNSAKGIDSFVNKFLIPFLRAIQNEGWDTGVAAKDDRSSQSGREEGVDGCETYYDISFGISDLQIPNPCALFSMIQIMKDERYDVVHCHTAVAAAITRMAAFFCWAFSCKVTPSKSNKKNLFIIVFLCFNASLDPFQPKPSPGKGDKSSS